jgi:hypothetical protein
MNWSMGSEGKRGEKPMFPVKETEGKVKLYTGV